MNEIFWINDILVYAYLFIYLFLFLLSYFKYRLFFRYLKCVYFYINSNFWYKIEDVKRCKRIFSIN